MRWTWVIVIMMSWLSGRVVTHICTGVLVSTIEADEVDIPTTRIPTVKSVKGGAIKTVELLALRLKKCGWSWITYYLGRTSACNGKLLWYYMWHMCLLGNATFNSNVTWDWYVRDQSRGVQRTGSENHWDHDETGCKVETADVAVTSSYPWHSL